MPFKLKSKRWYACELIGDEFDEDRTSYSPIWVEKFERMKKGDGRFILHFYHANYPANVRNKCYNMKTIERGDRMMMARKVNTEPTRILLFYDIDAAWVERHFSGFEVEGDVQKWLDENM